jgi:hypothetical protein
MLQQTRRIHKPPHPARRTSHNHTPWPHRPAPCQMPHSGWDVKEQIICPRLLPQLSIHPCFQIQLCGIGDHVAGHDARSDRSKLVERFAVPVLHSGQALVLPVSRRDIVADCVPKDIVEWVFVQFFVEVFAILADYDA